MRPLESKYRNLAYKSISFVGWLTVWVLNFQIFRVVTLVCFQLFYRFSRSHRRRIWCVVERWKEAVEKTEISITFKFIIIIIGWGFDCANDSSIEKTNMIQLLPQCTIEVSQPESPSPQATLAIRLILSTKCRVKWTLSIMWVRLLWHWTLQSNE